MGNGIFGTGIVLAVLAVLAFIVLRTAVKRFGAKRKCCGGGKTEKREEKILDAEPVWETVLQIGGLCCEGCAVKVENALNRMDGVKATACHSEKRAVLLHCAALSETELRAVIADCGFELTAIETKKL